MKNLIRTDSWAAALTEEQRWQLYEKSLQPGVWTLAASWAVKEFGLEKMPSQTAFYRWKLQMRKCEHEHRMEQAAAAAAEAAAMGATVTKDEALVAAFKALATEAALATDAKTAVAFVQSAVAIHDRIFRKKELALKASEGERRDKELALAREKFEAAEKRLAAVDETVKDVKLTPEQKVAELDKLFGRA